MPFLAKLFGSRERPRNETELIILVTPELVHPMEPEEVPPLPGFDVTEPTNGQFFLHGDIEGNPTQDYRSTVWPRLKKRYRRRPGHDQRPVWAWTVGCTSSEVPGFGGSCPPVTNANTTDDRTIDIEPSHSGCDP